MTESGGKWNSLIGKEIVQLTSEAGKEGDWGSGAPMGSVVIFKAKGYFLSGEVPANEGMMSESLVRAADPFEVLTNVKVQIGESDTIMGLELSLRHSDPGAKFRVRMSFKYAYGPSGRKAVPDSSSEANGTVKKGSESVPPSQNVEYEVSVVEVIDLDSFMRNEGSDEGQSGGYCGIFEDISLRKECGNRWFYYGDYERAGRAYSKGASKGDNHFNTHERQAEGDSKAVWDVYISCLNNLSACHISMGDYYKAKEVCTKVLEMEDTNIKALLRAARSCLALFSFEECEACVARVLQLEPDNKLAMQELAKLAKAQKEYRGKKLEMARRMTKNMFGEGDDDEGNNRNEKSSSSGGGGGGGGDVNNRTGTGRHPKEPPTDSSSSSGSGSGSKSNKQSSSPAKKKKEKQKEDHNKEEKGGGGGGGSGGGGVSEEHSAAAAAGKAGGKEPPKPSTNGYGDSSNLILLLVTAVAVLLISVWLASNSEIDVDAPILPTIDVDNVEQRIKEQLIRNKEKLADNVERVGDMVGKVMNKAKGN